MYGTQMPITSSWSFMFIRHVVEAHFWHFGLHYSPRDPGCHPEDGGSKIRRNVGKHIYNMAYKP